MKDITYRLYGVIFKIAKLFPVKYHKVVIYMIHNSNFNDNLKFVYDEMKRRDPSFRFIVISKKDLFHPQGDNKAYKFLKKIYGVFYFYIILNYHFASAEYILLNDNFLPLAYMPLKKATKLIQLWHGAGAFKRFGLSTEEKESVRNMVQKGNAQVHALFVTSKNVVPYYEEALGVIKDNIYPVGLPATDYYYKIEEHKDVIMNLRNLYPSIKHKKVILYAPTFRNSEEENNKILSKFDCERMVKELGDEYIILIRMHPQIRPESRNIQAPCIDVTDYKDVKELYVLSDLLITDYSSVVVEYALLKKPMIFYAYDLEQYDRGFYDSYEELVPGKIVKDMDQLVHAISEIEKQENNQKHDEFLKKQYDYFDGNSTKRVVDVILE
ncbi:CDP-glycerol glycerophosphotransferase family protein [Anaeromicropila herbilytica]|uniref:CDP-ribitol ribitolphosphotransferase n=1 Tax=Anaeromicropila herbilytica TaxID=2785025 RepID=A0A7R7EJ77_9FIRM|nr:CDP-glycerol glycerophosphotransferase family protein [Anaeromicropila herbilytica]BCN29787.1 hypothetical protein bsdtb5_10820 [Anaeromicropila herbilytica]